MSDGDDEGADPKPVGAGERRGAKTEGRNPEQREVGVAVARDQPSLGPTAIGEAQHHA